MNPSFTIIAVGQSGGAPQEVAYLLLEDNSFLLQEDNGKIIL